MFSALSWILGFYSNFAIAWVVVVATDITFNKGLLKLAPAQPEYRRGMIYNVNPVGVVSFGRPPGCRSAPSSVCWGRRWRRSRR